MQSRGHARAALCQERTGGGGVVLLVFWLLAVFLGTKHAHGKYRPPPRGPDRHQLKLNLNLPKNQNQDHRKRQGSKHKRHNGWQCGCRMPSCCYVAVAGNWPGFIVYSAVCKIISAPFASAGLLRCWCWCFGLWLAAFAGERAGSLESTCLCP